jgi:hypothetical protein
MNAYNSSLRTFVAREVISKIMTFPALTVAPADTFVKPVGTQAAGVSIIALNQNMNLRRVGLFCNFADGLVFAGYNYPSIVLKWYGIGSGPAVAGTVSMAANSNVITGIGTSFNTDFVAGDLVRVGPGGPFFIVTTTPVNPLSMVINGVNSGLTIVNTSYQKVLRTAAPIGPTLQTIVPQINILNFMIEQDKFIPVATVTGALYSAYMITAEVDLPDPGMIWDTSTIDTAYGRQLVQFDVNIDIEIARTY